MPLAAERTSGPSDFGKLARRLTWWTTNGLATAVVLVLALACGREIIEWWRGDEPLVDPNNPSGNTFSEIGSRGKKIQFGNSPTTAQTVRVSGDMAAAEKALRKLCREVAQATDTSTGSPRPGEQKLLAELANKKPLETLGDFRIDQIPSAVPMLAVSRTVRETEGNKTDVTLSPELRLVALGMAVPGDHDWGLYVFRTGGTEQSSQSVVTTLSLPPDAQITLSVAEEGGPTLTAIRGRGKLEDWEQFFRNRRSGDIWQLSAEWQTAFNRRQLVFSQPGNDSARCDVQFGTDAGGLWGLITITGGTKPVTPDGPRKP